MNYSYIPFVVVVLFGSFACSTRESYYVQCEYSLINDDRVQEELIPETPVPGSESYDAMRFLVCDTLGIYYSWKNPQGFFSVINIRNGKELGTYCPKGNGPLESNSMGPIFELLKTQDALKAEIFDISRDRLLVWNITKSLEEQRTVYDSIRPFSLHDRFKYSYQWRFRIDSTRYFTSTSSIPFESINRILTPRFAITSSADNAVEREYSIFTDSLLTIGNKRNWSLPDFVATECCIKPDKSMVAMGMSYYPQINILDLESGDLKCYRLKSLPTATPSKRIWRYAAVCCDNRYIYALYNGHDLLSAADKNNTSSIHIFDWDGNLIRKIGLGQLFDQMCIDGKTLYIMDRITGKLIRYSV